jgi:hypothetical protein
MFPRPGFGHPASSSFLYPATTASSVWADLTSVVRFGQGAACQRRRGSWRWDGIAVSRNARNCSGTPPALRNSLVAEPLQPKKFYTAEQNILPQNSMPPARIQSGRTLPCHSTNQLLKRPRPVYGIRLQECVSRVTWYPPASFFSDTLLISIGRPEL